MAGFSPMLAGEGSPTLAGVIGNLDSEVLHVVRMGSASTARVRDVVIRDPVDPRAGHAEALVLAIGVAVGTREAAALITRAAEEGAAAVVFRCDDDPAGVVEAAEGTALTVLSVPVEMPWGQVYALLRIAVTSSGAASEGGAAGVGLGDLFALADAVAASVGGPVTIEDPQSRVLAFSNLGHDIDEARRRTILGRGVPEDWRARLEAARVPQALRAGDDLVRFAGAAGDEELAPRLAAPVRAGEELLGSIWVAQAETPFDAEAEAALRRAAQVAAIHFVYHRVSDDLKRRTRGAFVREVLNGHVPRAAAPDSPILAAGPFTVMVFAADRSVPRERFDPERILGVVSLYCEDAHPDAMCALIDDNFWALLPTPPGARRSRARDVASRIVDRVESVMGVGLLAGIGEQVADVGEVPRSRSAAAQALKVLTQREGGRRVAAIDEVQAHAVLLELLRLAHEHPALLAGKVAALVSFDAEHRTSHVATLRMYLDCWGDSAEAARRLGVHANTLRYRVRKIVALAGLDLDDADERLVIEMQLRLHERPSGRQP